MTPDRAASRAQAIKIFEEFVDRLSGAELQSLVTGYRQPTLLKVDRRLARLRTESIEVAFDRLNAMDTPELRTLLSAEKPVGTGKKAWINHILGVIFGRSYEPPAPIKQRTSASGRSASRTPTRSWNVVEYAEELKSMTSTQAGNELLAPRPVTKEKLAELADYLGLRFEKGNPTKGAMIDTILFGTIGGRGSLQRAQNG